MSSSNDSLLKQAFAKTYSMDAVRDALAAGANPDEIVDNSGNTAIHHLINRTFGSRTQLIEMLLKAGADPDKENAKGKSPLHRAATDTVGIENGTEIMRILLDHKADLHKTDAAGNTPLHDAVEGWLRSNSPKNLLFLLGAGADIHCKNKAGLSPLEIAVNARKTPEGKAAVTNMFNAKAIARAAKLREERASTQGQQKQLRDLARKKPGIRIKK